MVAKKKSASKRATQSPVDKYILPAQLERPLKTRLLPIKPKREDLPPGYAFFDILVDRWDEIMAYANGHCFYEPNAKTRSMTGCEWGAQAIYDWVGEHEDELLDEQGLNIVQNLTGYEGLWHGDADLRHVWLEAFVAEPKGDKMFRWVIDPTANQFAVEQTYGYNDPRPLVVMPAKGPRYKKYYRDGQALDQFDPW